MSVEVSESEIEVVTIQESTVAGDNPAIVNPEEEEKHRTDESSLIDRRESGIDATITEYSALSEVSGDWATEF